MKGPRFVFVRSYLLRIMVVLAIALAALPGCTGAATVGATPIDTAGILFRTVPLTKPVDSILVMKGLHRMYVFNRQKMLKGYVISLGQNPIGHKQFQGDLKTPEGLYYINGKNPHSIAHKSLGISYPNDKDRRYARSMGKPTGGDIKIHGLLNGEDDNKEAYAGVDWTWGCIAVTDEEMDELYEHIAVGVPIFILP